MNSLGPMEIGLIVAVVIALICLILFFVALRNNKKIKRQTVDEYKLKEKQMQESHDEALEKKELKTKRQLLNKRKITKQLLIAKSEKLML